MGDVRRPVLLCESDPRTADLLRFVIETRKHIVVSTVGSAYEAVETMMQFPGKFCLVLTNQILQGSDGLELTRRIKEVRPGQPVLIYNPCITFGLPRDCHADNSRIGFDIHHMRPMLELLDVIALFKRGPKPAPKTVETPVSV